MSRIAIDARKLADFGIGTYLRGLVGALAEIDLENRYLLLGDPLSDAARALALPPNFSWLRESSPGYSLRELWSVSRRARAAAADLLHVPHYVLPFAAGCPTVVTVHDLIHLRIPGRRSRLAPGYAQFMIRRAVLSASATIAVSRTTRDELVQRFGDPARSVAVILNGVDDRFRRAPTVAQLERARHELGITPGYLLFVGNPKPHKNLGGLLAAYRLLRRQLDEPPALVLAGVAGDSAGYRAAVRSAAGGASTDGVQPLGRVADDLLPALYRDALALVTPSLWEGFGLPAAEALASGTPVVAARRGALPEVVADAGLLVDPEAPDEIAGAIRSLVESPELRAELARKGPVRAAAFRWQATARATLEVYRRLLADAAGDRP